MIILTALILYGVRSAELHAAIEWVLFVLAAANLVVWFWGSMSIYDRIAIEHRIMKSIKMNTIRVFDNEFESMDEAKEEYGPNVIWWIHDKDHDSCKLRIWNISREWIMKQAFPHIVIIFPVSAYLIDNIRVVILAYAWFVVGTVIVDQSGNWVKRFFYGNQDPLNADRAPHKIVRMSDWTKMGKCSMNLMNRSISKEWSKCFVSNDEWHKVHFNFCNYDIDIIATENENEIPDVDMSLYRIKAEEYDKIVTLRKGVTLWIKMHWLTGSGILISETGEPDILKIETVNTFSSYDRYLR